MFQLFTQLFTNCLIRGRPSLSAPGSSLPPSRTNTTNLTVTFNCPHAQTNEDFVQKRYELTYLN